MSDVAAYHVFVCAVTLAKNNKYSPKMICQVISKHVRAVKVFLV